MMQYGLIGAKLSHSYSPELHAAFADYDYQLCELTEAEIHAFFQKKDFQGINVTIPYKTTVLPYLYEVDDNALAIGAVNTIVNRDGKLYGYNTDFFGLTKLIHRIGVSLAGKTVLVLGSGGTSRTACTVAIAEGAKEVQVVGRTARRGVITYEDAYERFSHADYIINTTPVGMYPNECATPIDLSRFPRLAGVVDAIYNPLCTELVLAARERGIPAEGGLYMLVAQAAEACRLFTGKTYSTTEIEQVYQRLLQEKENIYLIGMPGSGKSTVGKLLAEELDFPFFDTDQEILFQSGVNNISTIFATQGEAAFRDMESRVVSMLASGVRGAVIATGGGAILRAENVRAMHRSGRVYFLDRPLAEILPTADRPLANDREAIAKRYKERYQIYCSAAHVRIPVCGDAATVAESVRKDFIR
jgi:shikimate dehydrogenase